MSRNLSNKYIAGLNPSIFDQLTRTKRTPSLSKTSSLNLSASNLNAFQKGKVNYTPSATKSPKAALFSINKSLREPISLTFEDLATRQRRNSQDLQKPVVPETKELKQTAKRQENDLNLHMIFKGKPISNEADEEKESDSLSTPKGKDSFITSESTMEKNEAEYPEILISKEKYGNYENLLKLYENERKNRENFEQLYGKTFQENQELRENLHKNRKSQEIKTDDKCFELHQENLNLRKIVETFKAKGRGKFENTEEEAAKIRKEKEMRESLENLKAVKEQQNSMIVRLQKENKDLKENLDSLAEKNKESMILIHKYQIEIQELNEKVKKLKDSKNPSSEKPSILQGNSFLKDSIEAFKQKDPNNQTNLFEKIDPLFSENENLKKMIHSLKVQLESNKHFQEIETLKTELEKSKIESESQKNMLKNQIEGLKKGNKQMFNNLRQKILESSHYEGHTLLKTTATRITEKTLVAMHKDEIISKFNLLKSEYSELTKKMLSQADEMFEKKNEIKQLNIYKTTLFKELTTLKEQVSELNELKEHVAYLFDVIQNMKEKIKKLGEMYSESIKSQNQNTDDIMMSMSIISEIVKTNIQTIAEKKSQKMNWSDEKGRQKLVEHLKTSLLSYVATN